MSVVLARGNQRFSGETDDYPPDVTRRTKKSSKEKKSYSSSRSVDAPLVTVAEPYPRGSLLGPLLNPLHKALYDTHVAISRAPGDLLHGIKPGERVDLSRSSPRSRSRGRRDSDEESDSEESTDSEEESDDDTPISVAQRRAEEDMATAHRRAERDLKTFHEGVATSDGHIRALQKRAEADMVAAHRRAESDLKIAHRRAVGGRGTLHDRIEGRKAERRARKDERRRDREKYVQGVYYGNWDAGKEERKKTKKHKKEKSDEDVAATGRFRLVMCYWDGQREMP